MRYLNMFWTVCLVATLVRAAIAQAPSSTVSGDLYTIEQCLVTLIQEAQVPAREPGELTSIEVGEGSLVKADQLVAQIADDKPQKQKNLALLELKVAQEQSKNDVDTRFAAMSAEVTKADYDEAKFARERVENSLSVYELRRREFSWKRALLQIEQAARDHKVAEINTEVAQAKLNLANNEIDRRRVLAPFAGVVAEIYPNAGEWVNPGDPILRLVRMDRLRVEGFVRAEEYAPHEVDAKPVTIEVKLPQVGVVPFTSRIGFYSPEVEASGDFRVWAEIENRKDSQGHYLVSPGLPATMILNMKTAVTAQPPRR
jgi:macrolide-specific efflux system membrane fusion protein